MKDQINTIREFFLLPVPHSPQDTLEYGRAKVRAEIAVSQIEAMVGEPVAFVTDADVACFGKGAQGEIAALLHRQGKWCHPLFTGTPVAQQPLAEVGNSGFDHKTAADFLSGKTVSDEAVRKFVQASRWAHDDRASLQSTLLSVRNELASREAEIVLLKKELMAADAAPQQAEAVPPGYVLVPVEPTPEMVKKAMPHALGDHAEVYRAMINAAIAQQKGRP